MTTTRNQLKTTIIRRREDAQDSYRKATNLTSAEVSDLDRRAYGDYSAIGSLRTLLAAAKLVAFAEATLDVWVYAETIIESAAAATMTDVELQKALVQEMIRTVSSAAHAKGGHTGDASIDADYADATSLAAWRVIDLALLLGDEK